MWDLSSPTKDWTLSTRYWKLGISATGPPGKSQSTQLWKHSNAGPRLWRSVTWAPRPSPIPWLPVLSLLTPSLLLRDPVRPTGCGCHLTELGFSQTPVSYLQEGVKLTDLFLLQVVTQQEITFFWMNRKQASPVFTFLTQFYHLVSFHLAAFPIISGVTYVCT